MEMSPANLPFFEFPVDVPLCVLFVAKMLQKIDYDTRHSLFTIEDWGEIRNLFREGASTPFA